MEKEYPKLLPQHQALLDASAIAPEVAKARGYRSVTEAPELEALGFRSYQSLVPALVVPVHDVAGRIGLHQIRPDRPRVTQAGKELKYETPAGTRLCLDVPPGAREQLADPKIPLWITEGARKADAAVSAGLCCVSLLGVWGWRGTNEFEGKTALADWDSIALNGREIILCFDSDVMTKESVNLALAALAKFLRQRGGRVRTVYLPAEGAEKVGLDDFLAELGPDALRGLAEDAAATKTIQRPTERRTKLDGQVDALVDLAMGQLVSFPNEFATQRLFHTPGGEPFAVVAPSSKSQEAGDVIQTLSVRSVAFRNFLASEFYKQKKRAPTSEALAQARNVIEGRALFDGPTIEVYTRIGVGPDGALYLDLADDRWRVVRVDRAGWNLVPRSPVRFRRAGGMLSIPVPQRGGSLAVLRDFVNVGSGDFSLLAGWLLAALRPAGPYPILVLQGEQGSAKSSTTRTLRRIIDPNKAELRGQPREPRDLAITCNNSWCVTLDNLSGVPPWLSDALCRVATGGGFATRLLYSDADEAIFDAQRPIILNGIDAIADRGDLLDRSIQLTLPELQDVRPEKVFWQEFEAVRPLLLGALLDAVVHAIRGESDVELGARVRMADAARWVCAAEPALPWEEGEFLAAYIENRADANQIALEASPVAAEMSVFVRTIGSWEGTAGELLKKLDLQADDKARRLRAWPRTPKGLGTVLRRLAPNLRRSGIGIEFHREPHTGRRLIKLSAATGDDRHHGHQGRQREKSDASSFTSRPDSGDGQGDGRDDHVSANGHPQDPRNGSRYDEGDRGDGADPDVEVFEW